MRTGGQRGTLDDWIDGAVTDSKAGNEWTVKVRYAGDFTNWKSHDDCRKAFDRLLRDVKAGA